jgi:hypothetical protein
VGYTVSAFAVDLDAVRAVVGSRDVHVLAELTEALADDLEQIDDMLSEYAEDNDDENDPYPPLTAADVLRHLVMGDPCRKDVGFAYGYCFTALCAHFGTELDNDQWSATRTTWFGTVQAALAQAGVSCKQFVVDRLVYRGPPVRLPSLNDFPNIGYLTRAEVAEARAALATADITKMSNLGAAESIKQMREWFVACVRSNRDLVCTYA